MRRLLAAALLLRLALIRLPGFSADVSCFSAWSDALAQRGPWRFYGSLWCDYPPLYLYALWALGGLRALLPGAVGPLLLKLPPILADLALGALLYKWALPSGAKRARLVAAFWLLNPAVWLVSAVWGQADAVVALLLCAGLRLATRPKREPAAAALVALAALTKPQALLLLPLLGLWALRSWPRRRLAPAAAAALGVTLLAALPFHGGRDWTWLPALYRSTAATYGYTSLNAFNLWALLGWWKPDAELVLGVSKLHWGLALFAAAYALILARLWRTPSPARLFAAAGLAVLCAFLLLTRMHERYAFLALPLLLMAWGEGEEDARSWALALSAPTALNLFYVLYAYDPQRPAWAQAWAAWPLWDPLIKGSALLLLALGGAGLLAFLGRPLPWRRWAASLPRAPRPGSPGRVAAAFFVAAFALYAWRLGSPPEERFDEVHHVKTARQFVAREEPTEWTHPHLGKLTMALSIAALGDRAFAWRLPSALFGAGSVALACLLGSALFGPAAGAMAAFLLLCDGLQFGLARIGMLDATVVFFILLAYLIVALRFFPVWRPSESSWWALGAALGLALSTKWTALYAGAGVLTLLVWSWRRGGRALPPAAFAARVAVCLGALSAFLYLLSFFRYAQAGHGLGEVLAYQRTMWEYHAHITDTHPYSSPWWSWLLMTRPVWTYFASTPTEVRGTVFLANPAVLWAGPFFLAAAAWTALRRRDAAFAFILAAFAFQYLTWGLSPRRLSFFHHFYGALPLMCVAAGGVLARAASGRRGRAAVAAYLLLVAALFAFFYPVLSGMSLSWPQYMARMWFRSWI
jgi:dolichyl-phosphate-mannose-protein mannosyltransferase